MEAQPENHRHRVLKLLSTVPAATTQQVAQLFRGNGSPIKRASEQLRLLEQEKLTEGSRLPNMAKVWRLTRKGRELTGMTSTIPLSSPKVRHALALASLYLSLSQRDLKAFDYEPMQTYLRGLESFKYAPDAFTIVDRKAYVVEVQLKPLSRKEWSRKWTKGANVYFNRERQHFEGASWNRYAGKAIVPHFLVVTTQPLDIVSTGFNVQGREIYIMPPV